MFEVLYISPSCKQAAGFIDRLMWDLRKCGIYEIEIDRRKLQLRTDKFTVSAIDIYSGLFTISRYMVKYYIDKVSETDFPCAKAKENALEKLKCLRYCFREDTKEILEEELIEILMEVCQ